MAMHAQPRHKEVKAVYGCCLAPSMQAPNPPRPPAERPTLCFRLPMSRIGGETS